MEVNGCFFVEVIIGGIIRIFIMGSRKLYSWLLTSMIEGIGLNVFLVNRFIGFLGKIKLLII